MARTRYIKAEFFDSEKVASLSLAARLLFIGLWTLADRDGRLELAPRRIKARLFPYDDFDVKPLLDELVQANVLRAYVVDGRQLGFLPGFSQHQRPHPNEAKSSLPAWTKDAEVVTLVVHVTSPRDIGSPKNDGCTQSSASTGMGMGNGDGDLRTAPSALRPVEKSQPTPWKVACAIAHKAIEAYPAGLADQTDAFKALCAAQGIDYGATGGSDHRPLYVRALDFVSAQRASRGRAS